MSSPKRFGEYCMDVRRRATVPLGMSSEQPARGPANSDDELPDEGPSRRVQSPQRPRRAASPHEEDEPLCTPLLLCAVLLVPCFVAAGVYLSISSEEPMSSSGPRAPDGGVWFAFRKTSSQHFTCLC
jgi:hypothetical protein